MPEAVRRRGVRLLHLQCWLWGQDVRRPEGNLLLQQGFERLPVPEGVVGCTQYTRRLPDDACLRLWGFGFLFGVQEGIFVRRYEFVPRHVPQVADAWNAEALAHAEPCRRFALLASAVEEIAGQEERTQATEGQAYRRRCLGGWKGRRVEVERLPAQWTDLAAVLRGL